MGEIVGNRIVLGEQDWIEHLPPEMRRHKPQVAIVALQRKRGLEMLVEIREQRVAGQMVHQLHPVTGEQERSETSADRTRDEPDALMLPASAQCDQRCREAERERRL